MEPFSISAEQELRYLQRHMAFPPVFNNNPHRCMQKQDSAAVSCSIQSILPVEIKPCVWPEHPLLPGYYGSSVASGITVLCTLNTVWIINRFILKVQEKNFCLLLLKKLLLYLRSSFLLLFKIQKYHPFFSCFSFCVNYEITFNNGITFKMFDRLINNMNINKIYSTDQK